MKLNLTHFWKVLPSIFTLDFWRVNKIVRKKRFGCLYTFDDIFTIKKWAKKKGYSWDNSWYLAGEKYLYKNGVKVCMIQPFNPKVLTRVKAHQPDYKDNIICDTTFLLNHNKTANALFECLNRERMYLYERDVLYFKIANKFATKDKEYLNSNEFLTDLAELSFGNYYDVLALKNNSNLTLKEKKQYIGDYCDYDNIMLKDYLSNEEYEELKVKGKDPDWNWTADLIPTALTRGAIDSVLCINPEKLPKLKVTAALLKRMHKLFFNGLPITKGK